MKSAAMYIQAALVLIGVAIVGALPIVRAQERPNFSGVWNGTFVSGSGTTPVFSPALADSPVTITQDESSITIAYVSRGRSHRRVLLTYKFDGSEIKNATFSTILQNVASSAAWEGGSVVITTTAEGSVQATSGARAVVGYVFRDRLTLESPTTFRLDTSRTGNGIQATQMTRFHRTGLLQGLAFQTETLPTREVVSPVAQLIFTQQAQNGINLGSGGAVTACADARPLEIVSRNERIW
jgi:hypothetical protein